MYIKQRFKWTQVEQEAFNKIKWIVACNNLLTYPNFNETFKIISHKDKPIPFYSIKPTYSQQQYTVTERELLSIV